MSKGKTQHRISPQILDEASEWFVEFNEGNTDTAARTAFNQWLRRSPEHVRAYLEISALWEGTKQLADREQASEAELIARALAEDNVVRLHASAPSAGMESPNERKVRRHRAPAGIAASLALIVSSAVALLAWQQRAPTYSTDVGEQRSITLADGSTIELNARTKVRIELGEYQRNIRLLEGQAIFRVAKDPNRPFVVHSGDTRVRAVGTEFDVYRKREGTVVTVLEGKVAVLPTTASVSSEPPHERAIGSNASGSGPLVATQTSDELPDLSGAVLLTAGQQVFITPQSIEPPKLADIDAATAWTERRVVFDSTRLEHAIEEFNRYNARPLVLHDEQIGTYHISGSFPATDPNGFLRFLEQRFNVQVIESDARIEIQRK